MPYRGVARIFHWMGGGGGGPIFFFFIENSLLVDRLRRTCEYYIELSPCYKSTTLLFSLLSQPIQRLSHEIKLLQPLCIIEKKQIIRSFKLIFKGPVLL